MTAIDEKLRLQNIEKLERQNARRRKLKLWLLDCIEDGINTIGLIGSMPQTKEPPEYSRAEILDALTELQSVGAIGTRYLGNDTIGYYLE